MLQNLFKETQNSYKKMQNYFKKTKQGPKNPENISTMGKVSQEKSKSLCGSDVTYQHTTIRCFNLKCVFLCGCAQAYTSWRSKVRERSSRPLHHSFSTVWNRASGDG